MVSNGWYEASSRLFHTTCSYQPLTTPYFPFSSLVFDFNRIHKNNHYHSLPLDRACNIHTLCRILDYRSSGCECTWVDILVTACTTTLTIHFLKDRQAVTLDSRTLTACLTFQKCGLRVWKVHRRLENEERNNLYRWIERPWLMDHFLFLSVHQPGLSSGYKWFPLPFSPLAIEVGQGHECTQSTHGRCIRQRDIIIGIT
mgnify:CR=1 FL=1